MQRNIAKGLTVGALTLAVGLTSFGAVASAKSPQGLAHGKSATVKTTKTTTSVTAKTTGQTKHAAAKTKAAAAKTKAHQRTLPGKVTSVGSGSLTITSGNKTYTVSASSATILDRNRKAIGLSDISAGDHVNVAGLVSGTSVTAQVVRDITIPKGTETTTSTTSTTKD